jgi:class 3 adenylate cyclase
MKYLYGLLLLFAASFATAQDSSIEILEQQLTDAKTTEEKMVLNFQLAEAYLRVNTDKSIEYGKKAHNQSVSKKNAGMSARSSYVVARGYERKRNSRNTEVWLKSTQKFAKTAGYSDLLIQATAKRSKVAVKDHNYRRAYEINQEAFNYFSQKGTSMSDLDSKFELQKSQLEKEKRDLEKEKDQLTFAINNIRLQSDQLSTDKTVLEEQQAKLIQANEQKEQEITAKQDEILTIEEEKNKIQEVAKRKEKEVKSLSREALEQKAALSEATLEAEQSKLIAAESKNLRNQTLAAAAFLLLLLIIFYIRFRSKRKTANTLVEKNKTIEEERQRSDELLLNILPASIASELKEFGKAKARKFNEASVLFTDFKNFTQISEQLTPEELVEELDLCFKAFDFIISQYEDIEKIKTIGDAYMCASGLSDRRSIPYNIVRAALEFQEFLEEHKQERMRLGRPYFEARIGIHTGPVVAGVVGVDKFAYDIWGDTVNIAARMESKSLTGKVNISESTYNLVRYKFECEYRGKVDAKNKGQIDMYFVNHSIPAAAAV